MYVLATFVTLVFGLAFLAVFAAAIALIPVGQKLQASLPRYSVKESDSCTGVREFISQADCHRQRTTRRHLRNPRPPTPKTPPVRQYPLAIQAYQRESGIYTSA